MIDIFEAARQGNLDILRHHLDQNPDLNALSEYGFTALQCAAMGSNSLDLPTTMQMLTWLVEADSPFEVKSKDGRTALYLLAEFSPFLEAVKYLVEAGANPNIYSDYGNHIVVNAMMPEVQAYLSELTGVPVPPPRLPRQPSVKLSAAAWKAAKVDIDAVFKEIEQANILVLQDAGDTQSDGFEDCTEAFYKHANKEKIIGFCFYTRQDLQRAKRSSDLPLAFWGAPDGGPKETAAVGTIITEAFSHAGFLVSWNGSSSMRPSVYLHKYAQ